LEVIINSEVKYGSETCLLQKIEGDFLNIFQRNCLEIVLGFHLTDRVSNNKLFKKCGSIPLSLVHNKGKVSMTRTSLKDEG